MTNNKHLNIYIPYWINDNLQTADNPYIYTLIEGIKAQDSNIQFFFNKDLLWEDSCEKMNIIHIMWPNVFDQAMQNGKNLYERIQYLKSKNIKIFVTCHNLIPHTPNTLWEKAYEIIYNCCDIMIHLGNYSYNYCKKIYPNTQHYIIPHQIYDTIYTYFPKQDEAFSKLNLKNKYHYILCMGAFRNEEERNIVKIIARKFKNQNVKIIAPTFYSAPGGRYRIWRSSSRKILKMSLLYSNIIISGKYISNTDLPLYYAACDIAFIQRPKILNSGNLPLSFLFGKVVVGPNVGNVGEILEETGNPTFMPNNKNSIFNAITKGLSLAQSQLGNINRKYAIEHWSTNLITNKLLYLYKKNTVKF